ncbi:PAS domain-containing sensor histidine kinase [Rufibacter roseus]|uniref:histidine kinase n=1 Tax=Rufibacter roseus TaxID=1567108 RepID=A0ABW2DNU2_9BACT|nr:PAS domain-containing sensor histidine kinase [Rufibacter roseus]
MSTNSYSLQFYKTLLEKTGQPFFVFSITNQKLIYQSPAFGETFQLTGADTGTNDLLALVHPDDQSYVQKSFQKMQLTGKVLPLEFRISLAGQTERWVLFHVSLQSGEDGEQLVFGHVEDITAQRHYQDHLKKFSNKKDTVLNILAHDLAGPLNMIYNLTAVLNEQLEDSINEEALHLIQLIEKTSRKGATLIQEFMRQEFLESSETEVVTRRVELVSKMRELIVEYQSNIGKLASKKIEFFPSREELYVEIDDLKFMQVITNLMSNALKFTPEGGIITIRLEEEEEALLISIADTGVGIPEKYHTMLFDKFTEARRPGLKGEQSVGLGMSIVKTIVDWHNGEIWFDSQENVGTTFYIRLPKESLKRVE